MPKLVLTYFDFDGGRGEAARLAMILGGVAFEDNRIAGKDWPALRDKMPFQAMPVLEVEGKIIAHSNTINRYVGKLAGLYPKDDIQAALVDEVMDAVEDVNYKLGTTMAMGPDEKKKAREALAAGALTRYLEQMQVRLKAGGGEFFADKRMTVADLKVYLLVRWLKSGALDDIPTDLADRVAPLLVKHFERLRDNAKIKAYYDSRKKA